MVNLLLRDDEKEVTPRLEKATSRLLKNVLLRGYPARGWQASSLVVATY
jgi:hypothetical protein